MQLYSGAFPSLRVAIAQHWMVSRGGAERVVDAIAELFPQADIVSPIIRRDQLSPQLQHRQLRSSFLQHLPGAHRYHRHTLMLQPFAIEQFDMSRYDLVLTSDAGPAKGLITSPKTLHICYCHTPMRYLWDMYHQYRANMSPLVRAAFSISAHYVRGWDFKAAQRVDEFVTNSEFVRSRILKYYRRESTVIYPPVNVQNISPSIVHDDYYLSVGRLVSYKRVDLAVQACKKLGRRLRVIGTGPEYKKLKQFAGPTVEFLGHVSEEEVRSNYARCRALLFPPEEDFGITPVEANAWGRPVIAYGSGGALESGCGLGCTGENVSPTAVFFREQTAESLANAILTFEANERRFDPLAIHQHAMKFDTSIFKQRLTSFIAAALAKRVEREGVVRGAHVTA